MKYYFLAGGVIAAAVVATFVAHQSNSEFSTAKRNAVEKENPNRPAHYQDLMFKPESEVQMRAPASEGKK